MDSLPTSPLGIAEPETPWVPISAPALVPLPLEPASESPTPRATLSEDFSRAEDHLKTAFDVRAQCGPDALVDVADHLEDADGLAPELARALRKIAKRHEARNAQIAPMDASRYLDCIDRLVHRRLERLITPRRTFPATAVKSLRDRTRVVVAQQQGSVPVEYRQALQASQWGIMLAFGDSEQQRAYEDALRTKTYERLAEDLRHFDALERQFGAVLTNPVPPRRSEDIEQLISDILNEREPVSDESTLSDDLLHASDLRVRYGTNGTSIEAYVQVTANPEERMYQAKRAMIRRKARTIVLVSPWNIIGAIDDPHTRAAIGVSDAIAWDALAALNARTVGHPTMHAELSRVRTVSIRLARLFDRAVERQPDDVRGPLVSIPAPIRESIRRYVRARARQGL